MRGWLTAVVVSTGMLMAGPAAADQLTEVPALEPAPKLSHRIKDRLNELSYEVNTHLSAISFDLLALRFDAHAKTAEVHLDTGDNDNLSLKVDSDVEIRAGAARVRARIDLGLAGRRFEIELPEFDMVPRTFGGRRYVELRLPLIEGTF